MYKPLADRIRPQKIEEVYGQEHLTAPGKLLYKIMQAGVPPNLIFYGPSGSGKTTIANILAARTERTLYKLNATTASSGDIKEITAQLDTMLAPNGVLLYLDEIQYFTKKQQQLLLQFIESGKITLIASTTENPYFYVYNALLSRCTVLEFKPVGKDAVLMAAKRALKILEDEDDKKYDFSKEALEHIAASCGGDVRKAVNAVELLTVGYKKKVTLEQAKEVSQRSSFRYDRDGDMHYDVLSAFQKSIRGSDENAALHYLARLIEAGDLISICRRLLVISSEDIGLAYPQAVSIVKACADSALQLGFPEAQIPLAQAVILLATAPKSNSGVSAVSAAMEDIKNGNYGDIPDHLKDGHYKGAEKLGRAQGYKYAHNFENSWTRQQYLPDEIKDRVYYEYGNNKTEQAAKAYWEGIKKVDKEGKGKKDN